MQICGVGEQCCAGGMRGTTVGISTKLVQKVLFLWNNLNVVIYNWFYRFASELYLFLFPSMWCYLVFYDCCVYVQSNYERSANRKGTESGLAAEQLSPPI